MPTEMVFFLLLLTGAGLFTAVVLSATVLKVLFSKELRRLETKIDALKTEGLPPSVPSSEQIPIPAFSVKPEPEEKHTTGLGNVPEHIQEKNGGKTKEQKKDSFESRTAKAFSKIWNWICVGEEFRSKSVSSEFAVATTWLIRTGVLILLAGIGFFLKYSIDNNLVNPAVRIVSSLLCGTAMIAFGTRGSFRKYRAISLGILGSGFVCVYLSLFASYRIYHLMNGGTAFSLMVFATVAALVISLKINAILPALTGCAGGYLTPVLLSDNSGNLPGFLAYLLFVCAATLPVARTRNWKTLSIASFVLFYALAISGISSIGTKENALVSILLFSAAFVMLSLLPLAYRNLKESGITLIEVLLVLFNAVCYTASAVPFAENMFSGKYHEGALIALFAACVLLTETAFFLKKSPEEKHLCSTLLCVTLLALSLVLPLLFSGMWITASFSIFGCILALIAVRTRSTILVVFSVLSLIAVLAKMPCDLHNLTMESGYPDEALKRLFTAGFFTLALFVSGRAMRRLSEKEKSPAWAAALGLLETSGAALAFFFYSSVEVYECLHTYWPAFRQGGLSIWWGILAIASLFWGIRNGKKILRLTGLGLFLLCAGKVFSVDLDETIQLYKVAAFIAMGLIMITGAAVYIRFRNKFEIVEKK